jgi:lipoprotein-anchoring transpeptidase ErfK/SrfK
MEYGPKTRIAKFLGNIMKRKPSLILLLLLLLTIGYPIQSAANEFIITIDTSKQRLFVFEGKEIIRIYPVSTSRYGVGNEKNTNKTPLGTHFIVAKIGKGAKIGAIFEHRKNTGRIARIYTDTTHIEEEFITTRILWLRGIVPGLNEGEGVDSYIRCIYIHGTPEEGLIGTPASNGCIRMKNQDIIELFDLVPEGTLVGIHE